MNKHANVPWWPFLMDLHSLNNHGRGALSIIYADFFSNSPEIFDMIF